MSSVRAFTAVPIPGELKERIAAVQRNLRTRVNQVRWTNPETSHLTLYFFDEVAQETLEKIKVSMLSVERVQHPFRITVRGLGAFPNLRRPRVIWLGLEPERPLQQLHKTFLTELSGCGVATENRPFLPHLTIGRLRQQGSDLTQLSKEFAQSVIGQIPVTGLSLYQSRLRRNGAEHTLLLNVAFAPTREQ